MATSFGALCTDFYVNQKLAMKLDLPDERDTVLHFLDRVRKSMPAMTRFRRYDGELSLESSRQDAEYQWLSLRRTSLRSGYVNPQSMAEAYQFHRMLLEVSPFHLSISPLDVDYLEVLFGFDLECAENHDEVIYEALYRDTPAGSVLRIEGGKVLDVQPSFGAALSEAGDLQAYFEVKTRPKSRRGSSQRYRDDPISLLMTLRKYGPVSDIRELEEVFEDLAGRAETLATDKLVPDLLTPIARQIASSSK